MIAQVFDYLGSLSGYGVSPECIALFGFGLFLFSISEFFRLLELLIARITGGK